MSPDGGSACPLVGRSGIASAGASTPPLPDAAPTDCQGIMNLRCGSFVGLTVQLPQDRSPSHVPREASVVAPQPASRDAAPRTVSRLG